MSAMLVTLVTSHNDRSALKRRAILNVCFMDSTRETSHFEIAELKAVAVLNMKSMFVAADVSQRDKSLEKDCAP